MTTIKGNKKEGAILKQTKTWGFHVIDYKNKHKNKPVSSGFDNLEDAENFYKKVISGEKVVYESL